MKVHELREKSDDDLQKELHDLLREQFNLRIQKSVSQSGRTDQFSRVRKDIARLKTVQNERVRAGGGK